MINKNVDDYILRHKQNKPYFDIKSTRESIEMENTHVVVAVIQLHSHSVVLGVKILFLERLHPHRCRLVYKSKEITFYKKIPAHPKFKQLDNTQKVPFHNFFDLKLLRLLVYVKPGY